MSFCAISLGRNTIDLRQVVGDALNANADGIVALHNHPSGDPRPSAADIRLTRELFQVGKVLGLGLRDHFIVAGVNTFSFLDNGLI
jgi:DNA repair protein RadC